MVTQVFMGNVIKPLLNHVDACHGQRKEATWLSVIGSEIYGRGVFAVAITGEMITIPIDVIYTALVGVGAFFTALSGRDDLFVKFENLSMDTEQKALGFMSLIVSLLSLRSIFFEEALFVDKKTDKILRSDISCVKYLGSELCERYQGIKGKTRNTEAWSWPAEGNAPNSFSTARKTVIKKAFSCFAHRLFEFGSALFFIGINVGTAGVFRKTHEGQRLTVLSSTLISAPISLPLDLISYAIQFVKPEKCFIDLPKGDHPKPSEEDQEQVT